ncbi:MAG: 1-deoxy-D-xylulose-5-phosphate reductoisomerase, partial [Eggerthellaceae bacterium]|nr:1-deoxy-D-xylulose-5-phosphate reductoisomerase [Eggerthellaceae bacterium]
MIKIIILGSSGSIGQQTLDVVSKNPDKLQVVALVAHSSAEILQSQAEVFQPEKAILASKHGTEAILELIGKLDADCVVNALSGSVGLEASYLALKKNMQLALANKESLVVGGDLLMPLVEKPGQLMPIDSE